MKVAELRDLSADQLKEKLQELKKESFNLRFQKASGELENTARMRTVKKAIARVQTLIKEQASGKTVAAKTKAAKPAKAPAKKAAAKKKAGDK